MSTENNDTNFIDTSTEAGRQQLSEENRDARDNAADPSGPVDADAGQPARAARQPEAEKAAEAQPTVRQSPGDAAREAIAKRFRRTESAPFGGDINDPEGTFGAVARQHEEPEPGASAVGGQPDAEPAAPRPTRRLIVRGQEIELTDDEILARAAKVTAADSYLKEARDLLEEAKSIKAGRAGPSPRHPGEQTRAYDDAETDPFAQDDGSQHPENPLRDVVESIQYGDPEEAAAKLQRAIDETADKKAEQRQLKRLLDNDLAKSQRALNDFVAANKELADDKMAARAIESALYDIYEEDIIKLGVVDPDQIPQDPATKANWHRFYRVNGHPVRTAAEALEEAKSRVMRWRGTPAAPQRQQPAEKTSPRVVVDRTERRAAIPNAPMRSVAPPRPSADQPTKTPASSVIQRMRAARGQVVA